MNAIFSVEFRCGVCGVVEDGFETTKEALHYLKDHHNHALEEDERIENYYE